MHAALRDNAEELALQPISGTFRRTGPFVLRWRRRLVDEPLQLQSASYPFVSGPPVGAPPRMTYGGSSSSRAKCAESPSVLSDDLGNWQEAPKSPGEPRLPPLPVVASRRHHLMVRAPRRERKGRAHTLARSRGPSASLPNSVTPSADRGVRGSMAPSGELPSLEPEADVAPPELPKPRQHLPKLEKQRPAVEVGELVHVRQCLGKASGMFWRGEMDAGVNLHDQESVATAEYRLHCQRSVRKQNREKAHERRLREEREEAMSVMRWLLLHSGPGSIGVPEALTEEKLAKLHEDDWAPELPHRIPTPQCPHHESSRAEDSHHGDHPAPHCGRQSMGTTALHKTEVPRQSQMDSLHNEATKIARSRKLKRTMTMKQLRRKAKKKPSSDRPSTDESAHDAVPELVEPGDELGKVALIRSAFEQFDTDGSGNLDQAELKHCLRDLGLHGRSFKEREAIKMIIQRTDSLEVCFDVFSQKVVPEVHSLLTGIRTEQYEAIFDRAQQRAKSLATDAELENKICLARAERLIQKLGIADPEMWLLSQFADIAPSVVQAATMRDGAISVNELVMDRAQFGLIATGVQERHRTRRIQRGKHVANVLQIDPEVAEHWREIVADFWQAFEMEAKLRVAAESNTWDEEIQIAQKLPELEVSASSLHWMLRDVGMLPHSEALQEKLQHIVADDAAHGAMNFHTFLEIIGQLHAERSQAAWGEHLCLDKNGLTAQECVVALRNCDVPMMTTEDEDHVLSVFEEYDADDSGLADAAEFNYLLGVVLNERHRSLRAKEEERIRTLADSVTIVRNYPYELPRYRRAFWDYDLDMTDRLSLDETRKALKKAGVLGRSDEEWTSIVYDLETKLPGGDRPLDFVNFVRLARRLAEEDEVRRLGKELGLEADISAKLQAVFQEMQPEAGFVKSWEARAVLLRAARYVASQQLSEEDSEREEEAPKEAYLAERAGPLPFDDFLHIVVEQRLEAGCIAQADAGLNSLHSDFEETGASHAPPIRSVQSGNLGVGGTKTKLALNHLAAFLQFSNNVQESLTRSSLVMQPEASLTNSAMT
eukprot:TRINITY_DN34228_c0_g1_i2.p1 TRINITY_DN34228_c0_g1~~TRINITY_DN34228_c0_g1_i2.p1  ORF type:complete len:1054 (+),score=252.17 TRINITY_DN34228_c0_g1_i2:142-3303(+)